MESQASISIDLPESDIDMPLNETDKAWIRQEIQAAHKRVGWSKLTGFAKDWFGAGAAITIIVLFFNQINAYTEFRVHTNDRLELIENELRTLQASSAPKKVLSELASLPPSSLGKNLPALRMVAQQSASQVRPVPETLQEVRRSLIEVDQTSPDYWPAVLQFIEFASNALAPNAPAKGTRREIRLKGDTLDGVVFPRSSILVLDGGTLVNERFVDSRIIFTDTPVILKNVTFVNCAFEFPTLADEPPGFMKQAGRYLLASNLQNSYIAGI